MKRLCIAAIIALVLGILLGNNSVSAGGGRLGGAVAIILGASDNDMRYMCQSSCGSISNSDLRYFCQGSCGSISDNKLRYYCQSSCGSI